jgi:hypothetical protein
LSSPSRTTAEEESTDSTEAMPGGSLPGPCAARAWGPRACRDTALVLIGRESPLSAQARTVASEESHASWYVLSPAGKQRDARTPDDVGTLFTN